MIFPQWVKRILGAVLFALVAGVGLLTPASAEPSSNTVAVGDQVIDDWDPGSTSRGTCNNYRPTGIDNPHFTKDLPLERWAGSLGTFHSRTGGLTSFDWVGKSQRDMIAGNFFSTGDMLWSGVLGMTTWATSFCPLDDVGGKIDEAAAQIGVIFVGDGNGVSVTGAMSGLLVVVLIITTLFKSLRDSSSGPIRAMFAKLLILAGLAFMVNGAMATTDDEFGLGSPGWILSKVNTGVTTVATLPASIMQNPGEWNKDLDDQSSMECDVFTAQLRENYWKKYGSWQAAALPMVMNELWEDSGVVAWKKAQFGDNLHADRVYCRLLDHQAGIRPQASMATFNKNWKGPDADKTSAAFNLGSNDEEVDVSLVAWANCTPSGDGWKYRYESLQSRDNSDSSTANEAREGCYGWWGPATIQGQDNAFTPGKSDFNWKPDQKKIKEKLADHPDDLDFILTMHSNKAGDATMVAVGYALSSLFLFVIFGVLSLLVVVAKITSLLLMLTVFIVLGIALLPGQDHGRLIGNYLSKVVGVLLLTSGSLMLFTTVALLTRITASIGGVFSASPVATMIWLALSPIAAVVGLGWIFKNVLKAPNPMSMKGMMAWAGAGAAIGGTVGSAVGGSLANRGSGMMRNAGRRVGERVADGAIDKVSGGRTGAGGDHKMPPKDREKSRRYEKGGPGSSINTPDLPGDETISDKAQMAPGESDAAGGDPAGSDGTHSKGMAPMSGDGTDLEGDAVKGILGDLGVPEDASDRDKNFALNAHFRDKTKDASDKTRAERESENGMSIASALSKRRMDQVRAGESSQVGLGTLWSAYADARADKKERRKVARVKRREEFRRDFDNAPLAAVAKRGVNASKAIGRGTWKATKFAGKAGALTTAAAVAGPAAPFVVGAVAATKSVGVVRRRSRDLGARGEVAQQEINGAMQRLLQQRQRQGVGAPVEPGQADPIPVMDNQPQPEEVRQGPITPAGSGSSAPTPEQLETPDAGDPPPSAPPSFPGPDQGPRNE